MLTNKGMPVLPCTRIPICMKINVGKIVFHELHTDFSGPHFLRFPPHTEGHLVGDTPFEKRECGSEGSPGSLPY